MPKLVLHLLYAFAGSVVGIGASYPAQAACFATARQPFFAQKKIQILILTQSIMQTPMLCAFIIGLLIRTNTLSIVTFAHSIQQIAAGLCIGLASIGPTYGLARFVHQVCTSVGRNRAAYPQLLSFTLISETIIESPLIFCSCSCTHDFKHSSFCSFTNYTWINFIRCRNSYGIRNLWV